MAIMRGRKNIHSKDIFQLSEIFLEDVDQLQEAEEKKLNKKNYI